MTVERSLPSDMQVGIMGVMIDTGTGLAALGAGPDGGLAWVSDRR